MRSLTVLCLAGILAAGCGPTATSSGALSTFRPPSSEPGSSVAVVPGAVSAGPSPTASLQPVPPGLIAFDRYDTAFGAEGPYLGSALIRGDGSGQEALSVPLRSEGLGPAWSPDDTRLLVNTWSPEENGRPGIVAPDGSDFTWLNPRGLPHHLTCFDWLPDGGSLLCQMSAHPEPDADGIYTLRIDDLELARLTESPFHTTQGSAGECGGGDGRALYSPDGTVIAFVRQKCGTGANPSAEESAAIVLMDTDGANQRELVEQGKVKSHPGGQISWSPDGASIAFGSQEGDLFLVDVETGAIAPIILPAEVGSHHADGPDFSPDGSRLVFSMFTDDQGDTELYTIAPDGMDLRQITTGGGSEHWARWGDPPGT